MHIDKSRIRKKNKNRSMTEIVRSQTIVQYIHSLEANIISVLQEPKQQLQK